MKLKLDKQQETELRLALKNKDYATYHRRIQSILFRHEGMTLMAISQLVGYSHQTIANQVKKYLEKGLEGIVQDRRGGRQRFYLSVEEEKEFLNEQLSASLEGEFLTVDKMFTAYQEKVGRKTTREGFYALLKRHGWRKVSPRPEHPKIADAETILASKNKIFISGKSE